MKQTNHFHPSNAVVTDNNILYSGLILTYIEEDYLNTMYYIMWSPLRNKDILHQTIFVP